MPRKSIRQQAQEAASYEGNVFTATEPHEFMAEMIWFLLADWQKKFGQKYDLGHELAAVEKRRWGK